MSTSLSSGNLSSNANQDLINERVLNLKDKGFSDEDIQKIGHEVPDLNVVSFIPKAGVRFDQLVPYLVTLRNEVGNPVVCLFNGQLFIIDLFDTAESVYQAFNANSEAIREKHRTPTWLANKSAKEAEFKSAMTKAYNDLPTFLKNWVGEMKGENYSWYLNVQIAKDAFLVATTLQTPESIKIWNELPVDMQQKAVAVSDKHSGYSFQQMVVLALDYIKSMES